MPRFAARHPFATAALVLTPCLALALGGCGGSDEKKPITGTRVPVLQLDRKIEADSGLRGAPVALPPAATNPAWPQAGGLTDHAMGHLALSAAPHRTWSSSIGSGSEGSTRLVSTPVVADGKVFALDTDSRASAYEAATGRQLWRTDLRPETASGAVRNGGVSWDAGRLYAGTGDAEVLALDATSGTIAWRRKVSAPVRGAPTVISGRVIVITIDNQTTALSAEDGAPVWSHTGILETAGLLGAASAAADRTVAVVPYSSGELFALRVENGRPLWSDNLATVRRAGALSSMTDIEGLPVIDSGQVLAIGHSGRMAAIEARTGTRQWEQELGGVDTPWPAGRSVFILTNDNQVVALDRTSGRVRWVAALERYVDPEDRSEPIVYRGPVLAGGLLWLTSSTGKLLGLSPDDGQTSQQIELPGPTLLPPVVADSTLYVLTDDGTLAAYR